MDKTRSGSIDKSHNKKLTSTLLKKKNKIMRQHGKIDIAEVFQPLQVPPVSSLLFSCEDTLLQIDQIFQREHSMSLIDAISQIDTQTALKTLAN